MTESQQPANAQHPPNEIILAIARHWQHSAALDAEVLERLYDINRIYLNLLASHALRDAPSVDRSLGKDRTGIHLANLDPTTRAALARCPFSLFNARFHNGHFWASQTQATALHEAMPRFSNDHPGHCDVGAFADLALFYAWHLVQSNPLAARILLGMAEQTLRVFKQLSLMRIQQLASEYPQLVTPRWPQRTPFWRGLLYVAQAGAPERIADMRLLGIQMIASELAKNGLTS